VREPDVFHKSSSGPSPKTFALAILDFAFDTNGCLGEEYDKQDDEDDDDEDAKCKG